MFRLHAIPIFHPILHQLSRSKPNRLLFCRKCLLLKRLPLRLYLTNTYCFRSNSYRNPHLNFCNKPQIHHTPIGSSFSIEPLLPHLLLPICATFLELLTSMALVFSRLLRSFLVLSIDGSRFCRLCQILHKSYQPICRLSIP